MRDFTTGKRIDNHIRNTTPAARARKRRWQATKRDRVKEECRRELRSAVERGEIVRPDACEICGEKARRQDGCTAVQGHHDDYTKPLEVKWLCPSCHKQVHDAKLRGGES